MNIRFVFVLLTVEICALVFSIFHMIQDEMDVYTIYNAIPIIYNTSTQTYTCFASVKHCIFGDHQHLNYYIVHIILINITIFSYISLLVILNKKLRYNIMNKTTGITWYSFFEFSVVICLVTNTVLLIVLFDLERMSINQCYAASRLVRYENLISYIILNILEGTYVGFDILKSQAEKQELIERLRRQVLQNPGSIIPSGADNGNTILLNHLRDYGSIAPNTTSRNTHRS